MSFVVSARKYRPQKFEDVLGQEHVTQTLANALKSGKLAHSYLFTGPRGVGKTTCARILAKVINCENGQDGVACNECDLCKSFDEQSSFNIIELDAASYNSVEHIRNLTDQVRFQPQQGNYKVYIIDEVHMLTLNAFNAFLKTLEEPPPYAIFILATTEKHKIIPTILSRCQVYDFKRIPVTEIVTQLEKIAEQENIQTEKDALYYIAEKADGGMRDALSIFDRIANSSDGAVTYQYVIEKLNILDVSNYFDMTDALVNEDASSALLIFNQILKNGFEGSQFLNGYAEHLRNLLVAKDKLTNSLLELSEGLKNRYLDYASAISFSHLLTSLNLVNECVIHYQKANNKRLHVEIALLKMCYMNRATMAVSATSNNENPVKKKVQHLLN